MLTLTRHCHYYLFDLTILQLTAASLKGKLCSDNNLSNIHCIILYYTSVGDDTLNTQTNAKCPLNYFQKNYLCLA